jgi:dipeptidyl aminopeptidase/acylaminoacyl peptidase
VERWTEVDGRRIHGWLLPAAGAGAGAPPLVTQIHGGPHTFYSWAPTWEFQVLAGAGMSVYASNPRGSDGYGEAFNAANYRDWATGPMRDVLAGIETLVADGLADPSRLGLTGGSYGGYLTTWMVAHDRRFRAAFTARSVSDMSMLMLTGDISGGEFGRLEFGVTPWDDPDYYREISPLTHAARIRTPLLIQHSEQDLRTTIGQAEALFTVLRSLRRPVRLMRVPEETHELTRSGTPFRRVENLVQVRDWFAWFLIRGRRSLPPIPKVHGGR